MGRIPLRAMGRIPLRDPAAAARVLSPLPPQVSSALRHMHERRMMHRDLKPSNIFITAGGDLKLGDLGLSRYFSSRTLQVRRQGRRQGRIGKAV